MTEETRTPYEQAEPSLKELVEREMVGKLSEEALQGFKDNADVDTTAAADTLARVAGKVILKADLDAHIAKMSLRTPGQEPDSAERKNILDYLVGEMVFDHELTQQKLFLNDNLANIVESKRRQFMVDFYLRQEVDAKAEPGTENIEAYYKEHKKDFWRPAQVRLREIMVSSPDTAKMIYGLLQEGVRFDSLAKVYSQAETGSRSGYVGYIKKDQSEKPYEKQAFKLKEGKLSKPIKIDDYYWLIKVEKRNEGYQRDEQEAHSSIRSILYQKNKKALEDELESRLVSSAEIVYFTDETAPQPDGAAEETPSPGDE
jgi:parvulin-like peptidyl-prolyl isomerase